MFGLNLIVVVGLFAFLGSVIVAAGAGLDLLFGLPPAWLALIVLSFLSTDLAAWLPARSWYGGVAIGQW